MAEHFNDKVVLVAGGTGALGRAVSLAFLGEGARVVVTYRQAKEFEALRTAAGERAASLTGEVLDVTDVAATEALAQTIARELGRIDVLVNAVGGYAGGTALWETAPAVFERMLALNLRSGFALARAVVPAMLRQGSGAVVNVASRAAFDHGAGAAAYAASKAAAVAMIDSLAADVKGKGVRVNSVVPSIFDTEENRKAMPGADFARWPKPEAIARVVLFLCSDEGRVIHGASLPVYGDT
ncbi:MAG TPA: SDR family NAD(P)-dependent oxidoreductase [Acidobacteriaceae bacterium]|jgi:NAD(P)-dependent dehydrogenase (short-subunit alcohol dehydrogenase family)|nr:SDR family NAD(P)-dependent oxidoreductase [Acidobacteriaceae bacterium]